MIILILLISTVHVFASENPKDFLRYDLERIISAVEANNWFLDEQAYERVLNDLMPSICEVNTDILEQLHQDLIKEKKQIVDPNTLYKKLGTINEEVENSLHIYRLESSLNLAIKKKQSCPFWVESKSKFLPRQSPSGRVSFAAESGGLGQLRSTNQGYTTGGGGAARLFAYYGINTRAAILAGLEIGGGAFVDPKNPEEDVDVRFFPAAPLIIRFSNRAWHGDIETAFVSTFSTDNYEPLMGYRVGTMLGFSTLRVRDFLPWAGLGISLEHYPRRGEPDEFLIKFGFKAGAVLLSD